MSYGVYQKICESLCCSRLLQPVVNWNLFEQKEHLAIVIEFDHVQLNRFLVELISVLVYLDEDSLTIAHLSIFLPVLHLFYDKIIHKVRIFAMPIGHLNHFPIASHVRWLSKFNYFEHHIPK